MSHMNQVRQIQSQVTYEMTHSTFSRELNILKSHFIPERQFRLLVRSCLLRISHFNRSDATNKNRNKNKNEYGAQSKQTKTIATQKERTTCVCHGNWAP